ncbi:TSC22 domain family protein 1-like isoform X2 [Eriocheir sinensis]|uniref:TSC22 domain family protein 1-like isoform X2 n=1 Tax=Eriocheir sinensis TaxID=95602 RepID=UPI0021CA2065|nr:TSC22 domain family protein 1-like isoform X2 [Eriocheir sinensis]
MKMDSLQCEFPHAGHGPITPPATPTQDMSRTPTFSECSDARFASHEYARQDYVQQEYASDGYSTASSSRSNSTTSTPALSPPESPMTTPAHTPLSTTPTRPATTGRSRKDSFVYDVRLTDEQFLFFVPDFDLVKSHLMFAVREEVEVLKEKITELLDRISQLEYENMVLRQYATQEALQKIQQHHASNT